MIFTAALALAMQQSATPYSEPLRPQFHFTAQKGWMNDPNGLVYFKGEYHLFFQHNPLATKWGNMTWGHAVSKDLIHWKQLPEAIEPDRLGTIFSGSAVVDEQSTAQFGKGALVCMYTAAGGTNEASKGQPFTQCLAYSLDGRNFTKHTGNPVLGHIVGENRDPKVLWYEPAKNWVLALYLDGDRYGLFTSPDLRTWTQTSTVEMPGASECPDFFELSVDGKAKNKKWVFWGANGSYRIGTFDGRIFKPETDCIRSNWGNTSYAAQTFFNDPKRRRIQIGWLNGSEFPGCEWNQQMGFPTELSLRSTPAGPRLCMNPIGEIKQLRRTRLTPSLGRYAAPSGLMDIELQFEVPLTGILTLTINGQKITYDPISHVLSAADKQVQIAPESGVLELRILADRASIELFAQHGLYNMPLYSLPTGQKGLTIECGVDWAIPKEQVFELKSAWDDH